MARHAATRRVRLGPCAPARGRRSSSIEVLAREAGLHPDLVRRFVQLGLLEPRIGADRVPRFPRDAAARLARASRLRRDLGSELRRSRARQSSCSHASTHSRSG